MFEVVAVTAPTTVADIRNERNDCKVLSTGLPSHSLIGQEDWLGSDGGCGLRVMGQRREDAGLPTYRRNALANIGGECFILQIGQVDLHICQRAFIRRFRQRETDGKVRRHPGIRH